MPLKYLRFNPPPELVAVPPELPQVQIYRQPEIVAKIGGPPPSATGHRGAVEFQRGPAWWYSIMERSYAEAVSKLTSTIGDVKADTAPLGGIIPCLVDVEEGHTQEEKERIRRAHRRMARIFANLVDRVVRYRPESKLYAYDSAKQDVADSKPLWNQFECSKFRTVMEEETVAKRKRKSK